MLNSLPDLSASGCSPMLSSVQNSSKTGSSSFMRPYDCSIRLGITCMTVPATPKPSRSTGAPWRSGRRLWGWSIPTWLPSSKTMPIYYESWAAQNKRRLWKRAPGRSEPELLLIRPLAKLPLPLVGKGEGEGKDLNFIRNTRTPPRTLQMHVSRPDNHLAGSSIERSSRYHQSW
jgi:hypothetical protein